MRRVPQVADRGFYRETGADQNEPPLSDDVGGHWRWVPVLYKKLTIDQSECGGVVRESPPLINKHSHLGFAHSPTQGWNHRAPPTFPNVRLLKYLLNTQQAGWRIHNPLASQQHGPKNVNQS